MFSLMLNPRFKTFDLVTSLINHEQTNAIVENMINFFLFPMLFKCHYHLHHLAEFERNVVDQRVEEDNNLDIFEMTTNTIDLTMELINKELLILKCYQVGIKDFKCPLQWWAKHETVFYDWCWC
jgi:hypothetical protein